MKRKLLALGLAGLATTLVYCGHTSRTEGPTDPGPQPTTAPTPAPTPVPAPTPTPPPANGCGLPLATGAGEGCPYTSPSYLAEMERAIDAVGYANPGVVDTNSLTWTVNNPKKYIELMTAQLRKQGFCVYYDGAEFAVKKTNNFSDQYRALNAQYIRRGEKMYKATCFPAWKAIP